MKDKLKDLEPLRDIRDTPEDRKLYPNDWMEKIYLTQQVYDDLLRLLRPKIKFSVPWMHPNKVLWVTLRNLVIGDTVRPAEESALVGACHTIVSVLEEKFYLVSSSSWKFPYPSF